MAAEFKYPPPEVETTPTSDNIVSLREAARRLRRDHRTLQKMIEKGTLRGGAEPQPHRLRWYVYADELPPAPAATRAQTPRSHAQPSIGRDDLPPEVATQLADQAAKIVTLEHTQRVLTSAVGDLLEAFEQYKAGTQDALSAAQHFEASADRFASSLRQHSEALSQHLTPGHLGDLGDFSGS
ncbi:hypothetical protein [Mycobacterium timonense]|uniref:DNA-binding protein n=1 Tax=Mycobacterium timonense TaxID=701043 RepID=A0ABX3TEH3_9MYCO|nr:hypothetical protein [Mycobacterium timonense]ORB77186.1 hypothetical protein BST46_25930 [Mycobacterium timonense]